jgi:OOP family OmpA-OmpF porin
MMNITKSVTAIALATTLASLAAPVAAQQPNPAGFYLGAGLGAGRASWNDGDFDVTGSLNSEASSLGLAPLFSGGLSKDTTAFGYKLFAGYRINQYFGVEGGWAYLGKFDFNGNFAYSGVPVGSASGDYKGSSWNLALVGRYPFGNGFSVQGKLGAAFTTAELSYSISASNPAFAAINDSGTEKKNKTNVLWGLGAGYDFTPNLGMLVEYENFGTLGDSDTTGRVRMALWSASLLYKF